MKSVIDNAADNFISGCWERFNDYYKDAISEKNIYIYGSGVYGKFLYQALCHLGYGEQIKAFINDLIAEDEVLFGVPVKNLDKLNIDNNTDIIIVGIQNNKGIIEKLKKRSLNYIDTDYDQSFYQDNLMNLVYKCIAPDTIRNMVERIKEYYSGVLGNDDEILSLYDEPLSKEIIKNRLDFYKTGNVSFINKTPVNYYQYFQDDYYSVSDNEVYVDCGAFDGDSINQFFEFTKGKYKKIIGLEPDKISFRKLCEATKDHHDVELICCATGKENTQMNFFSEGTLGSTFSESGDGELTDVKKLDDLLYGENVTLIKMDIEGSELDSLIGAENIIKKNKPKLAICIYHKIEDIKTIPQYLHSIVPEYRFKVRQHSSSMLETVLYAEV